MSFFKKLLGGTFQSNREEGDEFFANRDFGSAKLAYERALKKGSDADAASKKQLRERIGECRVLLAQMKLAQASDYADHQEMIRAEECVQDALQICDDGAILEQVRLLRERLESLEARALAGDEEELTEEELLAIIAGTWSSLQASEYANLPDRFHRGLICAHDEDYESAVKITKKIIEETEDEKESRFIYLELGRQLRMLGQDEEALGALSEFASRLEEEPEAVDEVVSALTQMGQIHMIANRPEEAEVCFMKAVRVAPGSHVPPLNLGIFLREQNELQRSLKCLENAKELMGTMQPDMRVIRELGFTCLAMDQKDDALSYFESVITFSANQGVHEQYDPLAAVPLAKLYEEKDILDKACDIYRHLATGYDTANHFVYNVESARLLGRLGRSPDQVHSYMIRSEELAKTDGERALLEKVRQELEN